MDGASFDQLSRVVHRLRHHATRRQALRTLAVGGLAGLLTHLGTEEAGAACTQRRRQCSRNRDCCGYPDGEVVCDALPSSCDRNGDRCCGQSNASCSSKCDCCQGLTCSGGRCRLGNDGGACGNTTCPSGQNCCAISGFPQCIDPDFLHCCPSAICSKGWDCCGKSCCDPTQKCCGKGRCCPKGWRCGKIACYTSRSATIAEASAESIPFSEPVPGDEQHWIEQGWLTVVEIR
jgi:hypothetical protein